ncbi:MAG: AarF/UbiB family protein, partial [Clostridium sp.]|nr:AarF/UbiB family protein [Clostridium sp.]
MVYTSGERVKEIIKIFTKYGLSYIIDKKNKKDKKSPANLRKAFEELGPTFIKIGQILSTRSDLIGEEYIKELSKLQDKAIVERFSEFEDVFRSEFSKELLDSFFYINKNPIASASIAQVYLGVLKDGREVVIKIQRPNIKERMYMDLDILISLSEKYNYVFKESVVNVKDTLMEIKKSTINELDFILEANNITKFKELNQGRDCIYVPYIVNELSGEKVLTLENISGFKINDIKAIEEYGYDRDELAKELAVSYFKQVVEDGFFHADPHPGNILISNGKICFIDFGIVGELSNDFISRLNNVIIGLVIEDIDISRDIKKSDGIPL